MSRVKAYVSTNATTEAAVNATTYNEQTSGAQRSIKSASASDAAAGTGARTVKLTYFTLDSSGNVAGPFSEVLTMNGVTAVPTVGTNICFVESLEILTAGSGGVAAGAITLYTDNAGAGTAIASIASGDRQTFLGHRYVPSSAKLRITDLVVKNNSTGTNPQAAVQLRSLQYGVTSAAEKVLTEAAAVGGVAGTPAQLALTDARYVAGPARVQAYVTPRENSSQITAIEFGCSVF